MSGIAHYQTVCDCDVSAAVANAWLTQSRAADAGFDWVDPDETLDKLLEEVVECRKAGAVGRREEVGDILYVAISLARTLNVDPKLALERANAKFERRWAAMERQAAAMQSSLADLPLHEKKRLWRVAKEQEEQWRAF